ncbi:N-acetylneuraminate synthase family protein, partial [candidate division KSB1 bacterium]|nr:N-acetylneuraminate synthase family protein [candidate division KSB1 bacterium]
GADAVKFQVFRAKTMYPNKPIEVKYLKNMGVEEDLYSIIKRFEIPYEWLGKLYDYARKKDIVFMATPFDVKGVKILNPYVSLYKIASYEALYGDLIEAVKKTGKPVFISLGGCSEREVDLLVTKSLSDYLDKTVLLHCIAKYPAPLKQVNLKMIPYLSEKYGIQVGYSDHTVEPFTAPMIAVALGAKVIEKHFTLSKRLPGPDHAFALEPDELKEMIKAIRAAEATVGNDQRKKRIQPCEKELYYYKRCLYYKKDLPQGHILGRDDFVVMRNTGIKCHYFNPLEIESVIGQSLRMSRRAAEIVVKEDMK